MLKIPVEELKVILPGQNNASTAKIAPRYYMYHTPSAIVGAFRFSWRHTIPMEPEYPSSESCFGAVILLVGPIAC